MEKQIFFQITPKCSQNCATCLISCDENFKELSLGSIKKEVDRLVKNGMETIYIFGGDPMMHKDILSIIKYIKKSGVTDIEMFTFGTLFNDKIIVKNLKEAGLGTVHLYFYDIIEKNKGDLQKVQKGIKNCLENDLRVFIFHIIYGGNYKKLPEFIDFLKEEYPKISYLNLNLINPTGKILSNTSLIPRYSKLKPFLKKAILKCKKLGVMFNFSGNIPLCLIKGHEECSMSSVSMANEIRKGKQKVKKSSDGKNSNKAPQCKKCTVNEICSGFYEDYGLLFGYEEFIPYKESLKTILVKFPNYKKING